MNLLKRKSDNIYQGKKKIKIISIKDSNSDTSSDDDKSNGDKASKSSEVDLISRSNNHIYFHKEINKKTICKLVHLIREAEKECYLFAFQRNIPEIPIYLHINSFGGSIFAAFSAIDVIKSCRVPIYTIVEGATASAGTLISIVGKKRYITPTSYMLIHQLSSGCTGKMSEIEDEFKNLKEITKKIKDLYREHCNIPDKELTELLNHDLWLNPDKCLKYGLADELWTK